MIIKRTTIAKIDPSTGLILKRIETSTGDYNSRKIAVNNTLYNAEKKRLLFSKPLLSALVQTKHIHFDYKKKAWRFSQNEDTLEEAQQHAENNGRFFIPYLQYTRDKWDELTWEMAESDFLRLARRGAQVVPYPIPLDATAEEWASRKVEALKLLNRSQELMPVLCSYHLNTEFVSLITKEFKEGKLIGIHCFNPLQAVCQANYNALYQITYRQPVGKTVPLVIGLCSYRYIRSLSNVSSAYLLSLFGIDIISYYVMSPEQVAVIEEAPPEEYQYYDSIEGGYTNSETQIAWYGRNLTREQLRRISVDEGLDAILVNRWADYMKECEDLDLLNSNIINELSLAVIEAKSRWDVARQQTIPTNIQDPNNF